MEQHTVHSVKQIMTEFFSNGRKLTVHHTCGAHYLTQDGGKFED